MPLSGSVHDTYGDLAPSSSREARILASFTEARGLPESTRQFPKSKTSALRVRGRGGRGGGIGEWDAWTL